MAALSAVRDTRNEGDLAIPTLAYNLAVAAAVKCWEGGMAAVPLSGGSAGYVKPATSAAGLQILGCFEQTFDNTGGANGGASTDPGTIGQTYVRVRSGAFWFANSAGGDAIAQANIYQDCFAVDDQTVALTDNGQTRSKAGKILAIDATLGVLVLMGPEFGPAGFGGAAPKIQVVSGITLVAGTKAVAPASFSLTATSTILFVPTAVNASTAIGAQYEASAITIGAAGTAQFTVTATSAANATATGDLSTLTAIIIG